MKVFLIAFFALMILGLWGIGIPALSQQTPITYTPSAVEAPPVIPVGRSSKKIFRRMNEDITQIGEAWEELLLEGDLQDGTYIRIQGRSMGGRVASDTVTFRARDFAPLSRISNGFDQSRWQLGFDGMNVSAQKDGIVQSFQIDGSGEFFDNNILDYICIVLAQGPPQAVSVPLFSESEGTVLIYLVEVKDLEQINVAGVDAEAIRVDYTHPSGRVASVWVDPSSGKILREGAVLSEQAEIYMESSS